MPPRRPRPPTREEGKIDTVLHKVERGENFWSIARLYYPSGRYYRALWKYNSAKVKQIDKLYVGTILRIPPPEDLDPAYIDPPGSRSAGPGGKTLARRDDDSVDPARADSDSDAMGRGPSRAAGVGTGVGVPVRRSGRSDVELNLPVSDAADPGTRPRSRDVNYADDRDAEPEVRPRTTVTRPIYKVRPYDTLRTIARDTLGDSRRAGEILELNRDLVDDPAHLIVGQILELPEDARRPGPGAGGDRATISLLEGSTPDADRGRDGTLSRDHEGDVTTMATDRANDLQAFRTFIDEGLADGGAGLTLDEALARWDHENASDEEREETRAAIRRGLADIDAGRVRPFEEFDREFRTKHGIPPRS